MRKYLSVTFVIFAAIACCAKNFNAVDFGANGTDDKLDDAAIQKAIDECSASGGGEVLVPSGIFYCNQIALKNDVTLVLAPNAVVKMQPVENKKPVALLLIEGVSNACVRGDGILDGNGKLFVQKDHSTNRPYVIFAHKSKNIKVEGVSLRNSAFWTFRMFRCDGVFVRGLNILSHTNFNNDGIDIDSKNVVISDCIIDTDDDALCLKSEDKNFIVENIAITNCVVASNCNPIKFGTANVGGFKNVTISNCVVHKCSQSNYRHWNKLNWMKQYGVAQDITGLAGIALEAVDGGFIENVAITNITMTDIQTPIIIRSGQRNRDERRSYVKNIVISNVTATAQSWISSSITGVGGGRVQNVILRDCIFNLLGDEPAEYAKKSIPENENIYPENRMFGTSLPSHGMYIRHADNITLANVQFLMHKGKANRPSVVADDVTGLRFLDCVWSTPPVTQ